VSGYLIGNQEAGKAPFAAEGRVAVVVPILFLPPNAAGPATTNTRRDFAKLIWQIASPKWNFDDATFDRSAASLRQPGPTSPS